MQLKKIILIVFSLLLLGCNTQKNKNLNCKVIETVYNYIPKKIPIPPKKIIDTTIVDYNKLKPVVHKYAINQILISEKLINDFIPKNNSIASKKEIVKKDALQSCIKKNLIYVDNRFLDIKVMNELGVTGIMSFTKIFYNKKKDKASVGLGIYNEGQDSSLSLYNLEKRDSKWQITEIINIPN